MCYIVAEWNSEPVRRGSRVQALDWQYMHFLHKSLSIIFVANRVNYYIGALGATPNTVKANTGANKGSKIKLKLCNHAENWFKQICVWIKKKKTCMFAIKHKNKWNHNQETSLFTRKRNQETSLFTLQEFPKTSISIEKKQHMQCIFADDVKINSQIDHSLYV